MIEPTAFLPNDRLQHLLHMRLLRNKFAPFLCVNIIEQDCKTRTFVCSVIAPASQTPAAFCSHASNNHPHRSLRRGHEDRLHWWVTTHFAIECQL